MKKKNIIYCRILINLMFFSLGLASGCRKQSPSGETAAPLTAEQAARSEAFSRDPGTVTCLLEEINLSKLDLGANRRPSFIYRMEQGKRNTLKQGHIKLENRDYLVLLAKDPAQEFSLWDVEKKAGYDWWGAENLYSNHRVDGKFYEFALLEGNTKFAARPYQGELGTFRIGKGGREIQKVGAAGSVFDVHYSGAPIGKDYVSNDRPESVAECQIPVGDYTASFVDVTYDHLRIVISNNYHANAQGQKNGPDRKMVCGFTIRKDQPFVLDFSNEPRVIFDGPAADETVFSRGEEIKFAAVLIDPKLDIMIRGLDDTSVKVEKGYKNRDGSVEKYSRDKSLDPNVVIARANGQVVAEGVMPFG